MKTQGRLLADRWGVALRTGGRWASAHASRIARWGVGVGVVGGSFAIGVRWTITRFDDATFRLMGGLSPGWMLGLGATLAALAIVLRLAMGREMFRRIWSEMARTAGVLGLCAASVRSALVGVAATALLLSGMNPARSDRVYLVVDKVGAGMKRDREALLLKVREIRALYGPSYDVRFDSEELETLVNAPRADWRAFDAAQQRLRPLDERLATIDGELRDRVGDRVLIISERSGDRSLKNYPLDPSRIRTQWISIGAADAGGSDRPEFTFLEIGNDLAVASVFRLALRGKIEPPDVTLELLQGKTVVGGPFTLRPRTAEGTEASTAPGAHFGVLGDTLQYECVLPREGDRLRIGVTGAAWEAAAARVPDLGGGEFELRPRWATVAAGEALVALKTLASFQEEGSPSSSGAKMGAPLRFVGPGAPADVSWVMGGGQVPTTGAVVELMVSKASWSGSRGMRLVRTADYNATGLGELWMAPAWVDGWPDLGKGVAVPTGARILVRTRGVTREDSPLMYVPDRGRPDRVVLVVPKLDEVKAMSAEHQRGLGQLLMLATSLAMRGGGLESPTVARLFVADDALGMLPEAGPREAPELVVQMWDAIVGRQDEQPTATPGNSARAETLRVALGPVAVVMALAIGVRTWGWAATRRRGS